MNYDEAKLSKFRFTNPKVTNWEFITNRDFLPTEQSGAKIMYRCFVLKSDNQNLATVVLDLKIGEKSQKTPFYINAKISSEFTWTDDVTPTVDKLLGENAVSLLVSYLRPMVAQFTTYAGFPPLLLPYLDVRKDKVN